MAAEQERLQEMTHELADIAVVDEFIRIEDLKKRYAEEGHHDFKPVYAVSSGWFSAAEVLDPERTYDEDQPELETSDRSEGYVREPILIWETRGSEMGGWSRRGALVEEIGVVGQSAGRGLRG